MSPQPFVVSGVRDPASGGAVAPVARPVEIAPRRRLLGLLMLVAAGVLLAVAARLQPDARGVGTHEQLGFLPCGFLLKTGLPCPTCGMTTAFAHAVRGRFIRAFLAQPAGLAFALLTGAAGGVGAWMAVGGRLPELWLQRLPQLWFLWMALTVFLVGWAFKLVETLVGRAPAG